MNGLLLFESPPDLGLVLDLLLAALDERSGFGERVGVVTQELAFSEFGVLEGTDGS